MACLNTLKLEIKTLEQVFPKNHERFQIMSASVDELTCRFVGKNGKKYEIHANITVSRLFCSLAFKIYKNSVFKLMMFVLIIVSSDKGSCL